MQLSIDMCIPLHRFERELTSADLAEYQALYLLKARERAGPVATPHSATKPDKSAAKNAFLGMFGGLVKPAKPG